MTSSQTAAADTASGKGQSSNDVSMTSWCCQVDRTLGSGAFGVVWCATNDRDGRRSAVKKLTDVLSTTQTARRAHRELTSLTLLRHDNLLSAKAFILMPNVDDFTDIYIISDLMETDLHRIIVSGQTLAATHVQLFIYQILRGLKYLHSTGIVHRDVKPANMLVNSDCRLKIGDFGLACSETASELEAQGGTLSYVAPELLLGLRVFGPSVDIWSAGCLLVELLTRRVLFQTNNVLQQLDMATELLGCPKSMEDFQGMPDWARRYLMRRQLMTSSHSRSFLTNVLPPADARVVHLLTRMLAVSPRLRMSASQALSQAYVAAGRQLYHNTLCSCCRLNHNVDSSDCRRQRRQYADLKSAAYDVTESVSIPPDSDECFQQQNSAADMLDPVCTVAVNIEPDGTSTDDLRDALRLLCSTDRRTSSTGPDQQTS